MRSFDITDPYVIPQFNIVARVLYDYRKNCGIAYTSNWYMVIVCTDLILANKIISKLTDWDMEDRPGRKQRYHYIKLKFNQSI